jgi:hypothetical protein
VTPTIVELTPSELLGEERTELEALWDAVWPGSEVPGTAGTWYLVQT